MYCIVVYDINVKRVGRVLKTARKYFNWVQNSVLEGEITRAGLEKFKREIKKIIKDEEDSVIIYILRDTRYSSREIMGVKKGGEELII
ncbi:MAG: CRISPR-associated endonuclease Cas2 [Candidatus Eremiobacteraeota bacterium]|nr:CRISPR-associated endonuclease Cas2 [Candidatus Eremiobacteraeota bacterium]